MIGAARRRARRTLASLSTYAASFERRAFFEIALTLAIGTVGAVIAYALHVPLAFMLGSIFANMIACFLRAPVRPPIRLRTYFFAIIGLFLSEGFTREVVLSMPGWWPSLFLAVVYPVAIGAVCFVFYVRMRAMSRADSLFSAIPGGLSGVVLVSGAFGADERNVALSHALRIAMIVLVAPAFFFGVLGFSEPDLTVSAEELISWRDALILAIASLIGIRIARALAVPLATLMAPLIVGAVLRGAGVVEGLMPELLVEAALIVVGASIGARFAGVTLAHIGLMAFWTALGTAVMVVGTLLFALAATATTEITLLPAILAFAPGGVAEMTLISIAMESDPAYVAAHHLMRLAFILIATPFIAPFLIRWLGFQAAPDAAAYADAMGDRKR